MLARVRLGQSQRRTRSLRRQRIHGETITRGDHIEARAGERLAELHQQFMRAVAEQELRNIHIMVRGKRSFEIAAKWIRIAMQCIE